MKRLISGDGGPGDRKGYSLARRPGRLSESRPGSSHALWPATDVIGIGPTSLPSWPSRGHHARRGQRASWRREAQPGPRHRTDGGPALWSDEANVGAASPEQGQPPRAGHWPIGLSPAPSAAPARAGSRGTAQAALRFCKRCGGGGGGAWNRRWSQPQLSPDVLGEQSRTRGRAG